MLTAWCSGKLHCSIETQTHSSLVCLLFRVYDDRCIHVLYPLSFMETPVLALAVSLSSWQHLRADMVWDPGAPCPAGQGLPSLSPC